MAINCKAMCLENKVREYLCLLFFILYQPSIFFSLHSIPFAWKFQKIRISGEKKVTRIKNAQARPIYSVKRLRDGTKKKRPDQEWMGYKESTRYELHCNISHFELWKMCYVTLRWIEGERAMHTYKYAKHRMRM